MQVLDRVNNPKLLAKITDAQTAAAYIKNGMTIGVSGFAACGYPKVVPKAIAKRAEEGEQLSLNLISSANLGPEIEETWAQAGILSRRIPFQMNSPICAKNINQGNIDYVEMPLSKVSKMLRNGVLGEIDIAIVEALRIKKGGRLVLTTAVGVTPAMLQCAKEIIVEINKAQPLLLEGIHDIYLPNECTGKSPIPLFGVNQHIGTKEVVVDPEKIKYIVASDIPDVEMNFTPPDIVSNTIADNLLNFIEFELHRTGRKNLPPIQTGIGNAANNIAKSFERSNFKDISFFCGVLQEGNIEMLESGQAIAASGSAVNLTEKVRQIFYKNPDMVHNQLILRPMEVSNSAEIIDRMQLISLNSAIELDIYGNANLSHLMGSRVVNGIGGAGAFTQNALLSVMLFPSNTKNGDISTIVPKVTHQDVSVHNIDVVITEQGIADLRGKTPVERAKIIIENCAHTSYRDELFDYLNKSIQLTGGHEPQLLDECYSWHKRLKETGSMIKKG